MEIKRIMKWQTKKYHDTIRKHCEDQKLNTIIVVPLYINFTLKKITVTQQ
jgi:hypothetical protein